MRATLSPAFTSSKIKIMFELMMKVGDQLIDHLRKELAEKGSCERMLKRWLV